MLVKKPAIHGTGRLDPAGQCRPIGHGVATGTDCPSGQ